MKSFAVASLILLCSAADAATPLPPSIDTSFFCGSVSQCRAPGYSSALIDRGGINADFLQRIFVLPDQRTLMVGIALNGSNTIVVLAMLTASGILDSGFAPQGVAQTGLQVQLVHDVQRDTSGRIWILYTPPGTGDLGLARLLPSGALDSSFSGDGRFTFDLGTAAPKSFGRLDLTVDGRAFVAATVQDTSEAWRPGFARITPSGALDSTFQNNGVLIMTPARTARWTAETVSLLNRPRDFALATFAENGSSGGDESMLLVRFENIAGGNATAGQSFYNAGASPGCNGGVAVQGYTSLRAALVRANGDLIGVGLFKTSSVDNLMMMRVPLSGAATSECFPIGDVYKDATRIAAVNQDTFALLSLVDTKQLRLDYMYLNGNDFTPVNIGPHRTPRTWPNNTGADADLAYADIAISGSKIVLGGSRLWAAPADYDFAVARYDQEVLFSDSF